VGVGAARPSQLGGTTVLCRSSEVWVRRAAGRKKGQKGNNAGDRAVIYRNSRQPGWHSRRPKRSLFISGSSSGEQGPGVWREGRGVDLGISGDWRDRETTTRRLERRAQDKGL
jgi:hypothetical protein